MKRTWLVMLVLIASHVFSGCSTTYHASSLSGGFTDKQLGADTFQILFKGNTKTPGEKAEDFAMLRAADLCLEHGFNYFAILDSYNTTNSLTVATKSENYSANTVTLDGDITVGSGVRPYRPSETHTFHSPQTDLVIKGYRAKPGDTHSFDAASLEKSIREKYHIQ